MKRRSFLKFLGLAPAVPVVAKAAEHFPKGLLQEPVPEPMDVGTPFGGAEKYSSTTEYGWTCSVSAPPVSFYEIKSRWIE